MAAAVRYLRPEASSAGRCADEPYAIGENEWYEREMRRRLPNASIVCTAHARQEILDFEVQPQSSYVFDRCPHVSCAERWAFRQGSPFTVLMFFAPLALPEGSVRQPGRSNSNSLRLAHPRLSALCLSALCGSHRLA